MFHAGLAERTLVALDIAPQTSSANVNGAVIDMQGWDACEFIFGLGAMTGTFVAYIQASANANMSGATNLAGAVLASVPSTSNGNVAIIDVYKPGLRYIQSVAAPTGGNVFMGSVATRYRRGGTLPPTQAAVQVVRVALN